MNLNLKQLNSMRLRPNFKRKLFYDSNLLNKNNVIKMALINQDKVDCSDIIEIIMEDKINKYGEKIMGDSIDEMETNLNSLGNTNPVDIMLDTLKIVESIKTEYKDANINDKKLFVKFFFYGMIFMFSSMVMSLWALGFWDTLFYVKFIGGTICSLAFAFTVGKIKEVIPVISDNYEAMKTLLNKIVTKLSN